MRNIRPSFRFGLWGGMLYSALDTYVLRGKAPWTLRHHADHTQLAPKAACSADRLSEAGRQAHLRPPVVGLHFEHQSRR